MTKKKDLKELIQEISEGRNSPAVVVDCVQMTNNGEWKRLTPGFGPGGDERLVLLTDKN